MSTPTLTPAEILRAKALLPDTAEPTLAFSVHEIAVHLLRQGVYLITDPDATGPSRPTPEVEARARSKGQRMIATALRILDSGKLPDPPPEILRYVTVRVAYDPDATVELVLADPDLNNAASNRLYTVPLDFFRGMVLLSNLAQAMMPAAAAHPREEDSDA